jgi:hypothetical protein
MLENRSKSVIQSLEGCKRQKESKFSCPKYNRALGNRIKTCDRSLVTKSERGEMKLKMKAVVSLYKVL